jgi:hypothetical protein
LSHRRHSVVSCCSPVPPHEQWLTAVVQGAGLVVVMVAVVVELVWLVAVAAIVVVLLYHRSILYR